MKKHILNALLVALCVAACDDQPVELDSGATDGATPDVAVDMGPDALPDLGPDAAPDVGPDAAPDVGPDAAPDVGPDAAPDLGPDAAPDLGPDAAPDVGPDAEPDAELDLGPDAELDLGPDAFDVGPDADPDMAVDAEPDLGPDAEPDLGPDADPDMAVDAAPDMGADAAQFAGWEGASEHCFTIDVGATSVERFDGTFVARMQAQLEADLANGDLDAAWFSANPVSVVVRPVVIGRQFMQACFFDAVGEPNPIDSEQLCGTVDHLRTRLVDTDGDGLSDPEEVLAETNPNVDDGALDTDGGGENDASEIANGRDPDDPNDDNPAAAALSPIPTAPLVRRMAPVRVMQGEPADADMDGLTREVEEELGTDPENPDTDGDGVNDGDEFELGSDPLDPDDPGDPEPEPEGGPQRSTPLDAMRVWHLNAVGIETPDLEAPPVLPMGREGEAYSVVILVDSGVDPEMYEPLGVFPGALQDLDLDPGAELHGHGTAMAYFARQVARRIGLMDIRILGDDGIGTIADLARALAWVDETVMCDDGPVPRVCNPIAGEVCNFVDDDCDGIVDEDVAGDCGAAPPICCRAAGEHRWRENQNCAAVGGLVVADAQCVTSCCRDGGNIVPVPAGDCEGVPDSVYPIVVNLSLGWPDELSGTQRIAGDACDSVEDPAGEPVRAMLDRLGNRGRLGEPISVFAAAGNRPGREPVNLQTYPVSMAVAADNDRADTCPDASPADQQWFLPANWARIATCDAAGEDPRHLLDGVGAVRDDWEETIQSIRGTEGPLVAPGEHVYVAHPSLPTEPPVQCGRVAADDNRLHSPYPLTGSSVATVMTAAAVARGIADRREQNDAALSPAVVSRLAHATGCDTNRDAGAVGDGLWEGTPTRMLNVPRLVAAMTEPGCQQLVQACAQINVPTDRFAPCGQAALGCIPVDCPQPVDRLVNVDYEQSLTCVESDGDGTFEYADSDQECGLDAGVPIPCDFEVPYDRYSSGHAGGQPGEVGCPDCSLYGDTAYLEVSNDPAFTAAYLLRGAYIGYINENTGAVQFINLPSLMWSPGATNKITNLPGINPNGCPKDAWVVFELKKASSGTFFTDTSALRVDCN